MQLPKEVSDLQIDDLQYNDIILAIEGKNVSEIVSEYTKYISGSNEASRNRFITNEMRRGWNTISEVTVLRNKELKNLMILRIPNENPFNEFKNRFSQPNNWSLIDQDIGFIQPSQMTKKDFDKAFDKLKKN